MSDGSENAHPWGHPPPHHPHQYSHQNPSSYHHGGPPPPPPPPAAHQASMQSQQMNHYDPRYQHHPHHAAPQPPSYQYDYWYQPEPPKGRRESLPYAPQPQPISTATPTLQPPSHYNGPPVSALVPRVPRNPQNALYEHGRYNPRQSFGTYTNNHFMIPTPPQGSTSMMGHALDDSPPAIPVPPPPPSTEQRPTHKTSGTVLSAIKQDPLPSSIGASPKPRTPLANAMPDSNRINLLDKKFDAAHHPPSDHHPPSKIMSHHHQQQQQNPMSLQPPPLPVVKEANLLLSLKSDSTSSPMPETKKVYPKSCFPAKIPKNYPKRLALRDDNTKLNSLHCFVREELLEIFVVEPSEKKLKFRHAPSSSVGRVGLRCLHCHNSRQTNNPSRDGEAPMAVFYPKSIAEIYRLVTSWQRCHLRKCSTLPPPVRKRWETLRATEKSRGKTAYWATSAHAIGLRDCPSRAGGVYFEVNDDTEPDEEPEEVVA